MTAIEIQVVLTMQISVLCEKLESEKDVLGAYLVERTMKLRRGE